MPVLSPSRAWCKPRVSRVVMTIEFLSVWIDDLFLQHYVIFKGFNVFSTMTYSDISWDYILIGLMFFALIEVIRQGIAIQDENDLTI